VRWQPPGREPWRGLRVDFDNQRAAQPARLEHDGHRLAGTRLGPRAARHRVRRRDVYIAASDELFAFTPDFELIGSWRNPYLKHCHEISRHERTLFMTSTGFDSVVGFDLDSRTFSWGMRISAQGDASSARPFDPLFENGPPPSNTLHLNSVFCAPGGMHIGGLRTAGLLLYNGRETAALGQPAGRRAQRTTVP
jgi:hypothetical protein